MTIEEILKNKFTNADKLDWYKPISNAMEEYAKEVAIDFCLHVCGQLKWPENKMGYDENSNEHTLLLLPATIDNRFYLYIQSKQITNEK